MGLQSLVQPLLAIAGPLTWWDERAAFVAAAVLLPLIFTYTWTFFNAIWTKNGRAKGSPPLAPYAVPVLGNTFQFAYDTEGFLWRTL